MLSLLGENHRLPLFHMDENFIWLNETICFINEFKIGYIINPNLNIKKAFREQVDKCMSTAFGAITQTHIRATLSKNKTMVLALLMFYETKEEKITNKVLSCVIYTIIKYYVCIYYLACQSKQLSEIPVDSGGGYKHGKKVLTKYWALEIQICE